MDQREAERQENLGVNRKTGEQTLERNREKQKDKRMDA
jgi:hypothetical protein